ncbi:polysaccharide synthesis protein GtrA [Pollutimonas nitritireducens]|uniref:Polysaccharide synthesis protein GtrA n=1 Tax=Pollutimonas nitritireducens TaxID=2045209 RepID=A0A2N4UKD5_9BURK|nr:GtrA family protein [Pollutimonas nitritireducens]PLC55494.1 polysaccharide synthesis protein GtrA [Pollutimonas nitritireducens]
MKTIHEFLFFAIAGVCGFVVDTAVLYALTKALGPFYARGVSFVAAVLATWLINRAYAFRKRRSALTRRREFLFYLVLMLAGGAVNYGVYSWLVLSYPLVQQHLIIGVAAGSVAGMLINFMVSRFLLYRHTAGQ